MKTVLYQAIGRASLCFDWIRPVLAKGGRTKEEKGDFDKTGLVIKEVRPLEVLWRDREIVYVDYDSFAHSFWRAQEFSLFEKNRQHLNRPLLDFGCGDGSFASVLFKEIDYGVDNDPEALEQANKFRIYNNLLQSTDETIPLGSASVQSVISNSVLEHVANLDNTLSEISRILKKDGVFIFSVPVYQFKNDLAKYFGKNESERINKEYHHKNLFKAEEWKILLERHGFFIVLLKQFQPDWFTFWYRMFRLLGQRGLGRIFPGIGIRIWKMYTANIINMIKMSIHETKRGANIFIIARLKQAS